MLIHVEPFPQREMPNLSFPLPSSQALIFSEKSIPTTSAPCLAKILVLYPSFTTCHIQQGLTFCVSYQLESCGIVELISMIVFAFSHEVQPSLCGLIPISSTQQHPTFFCHTSVLVSCHRAYLRMLSSLSMVL